MSALTHFYSSFAHEGAIFYTPLFNRLAWCEKGVWGLKILSAVWKALEADIQGADHRGLLLDGLLQIRLAWAHQGHQSLGQRSTKHQVDAGVRTAVKIGQQHQDGEGCSWKHMRRKWEEYSKVYFVLFLDHFFWRDQIPGYGYADVAENICTFQMFLFFFKLNFLYMKLKLEIDIWLTTLHIISYNKTNKKTAWLKILAPLT